MNQSPQILFVDDDGETARAYADLVAKQTGLMTMACSSRAQALEMIENGAVGVVVLDQRMPEISGTALYGEMLLLRPSLKAVMLSGEASRNDVAAAMNLGYSADVNKSDLAALPREVLRAYAIHCRDRAQRVNPPVLLGRRGVGVPLLPRVEYYLHTIELLVAPHIPENEWRLTEQISAGQTKEIKTTVRLKEDIVIESSYDASISGSTELEVVGIAKMRSKIGSEVRSRLSQKSGRSFETERQITETLSLPAEPVDPLQSAVKSRGFYVGEEYLRVRLGIEKKFRPFSDASSMWLEVTVPTGRLGTKQVDVLTDGSRLERFTHFF